MSQVFKQDLTDTSVRPGGLFFVELLMPRPKFEKAVKKIVSRLPENE